MSSSQVFSGLDQTDLGTRESLLHGRGSRFLHLYRIYLLWPARRHCRVGEYNVIEQYDPSRKSFNRRLLYTGQNILNTHGSTLDEAGLVRTGMRLVEEIAHVFTNDREFESGALRDMKIWSTVCERVNCCSRQTPSPPIAGGERPHQPPKIRQPRQEVSQRLRRPSNTLTHHLHTRASH